MNPFVIFWPAYRASSSAFILGLVVLALLDAARIFVGTGVGILGFILFWAMMFFVLSLHMNRLRHAERNTGMAFLPVGLAFVAKGIAAFVAFFGAMAEVMVQFAEGQGIDSEDPNEFQQAVSDPAFQEAFQQAIANDPALLERLGEAGALPSFIVFWIVIVLFAIWFAQIRRNGGSLESGGQDSGPGAQA